MRTYYITSYGNYRLTSYKGDDEVVTINHGLIPFNFEHHVPTLPVMLHATKCFLLWAEYMVLVSRAGGGNAIMSAFEFVLRHDTCVWVRTITELMMRNLKIWYEGIPWRNVYVNEYYYGYARQINIHSVIGEPIPFNKQPKYAELPKKAKLVFRHLWRKGIPSGVLLHIATFIRVND